MTALARQTTPLGRLVRFWRRHRALSQEALAAAAGLSTRHLSFIETGRSQPSREVVVGIAQALGVADAAVGAFLEAAGYLAPYADQDFAAPPMRALVDDLHRLVRGLREPALVHDRFGTLLARNRIFEQLVGQLVDLRTLQTPWSGHQLLPALRPCVDNWDDVAELYRWRLFRELVRGEGSHADDAQLEVLYRQWSGEDPGAGPTLGSRIFTALVLRQGEVVYRFRFVTSTLGVPTDIPLRNLRLVLILPDDEPTRARLERLSD